MKTLYLECNMGAAGDMLMAALLELHENPDDFLCRLNSVGIPGVSVAAKPSKKCGITGTQVCVEVNGEEEITEDHHHEHPHGHKHSHIGDHNNSHNSFSEIEHKVGHLSISETVKNNVIAIYRLIAEAESCKHGVPINQIHFHEVGELDAVADIVGVCMLIEELAADKILASPIKVGSGQVRCAHGILPVPAPATAHILTDVPYYGGNIKGELCTPTGAAILKHFANGFINMPEMIVKKVGYGMGKKDFEMANCVRAFLGESAVGEIAVNGAGPNGFAAQLCCNVDDMTGEALGYACQMLIESGAMDAFTTAIGMKKGRPGVMLTCLCDVDRADEFAKLMLRYTTTFGVRKAVLSRYMLEREIQSVQTSFGEVRMKIGKGYGTIKSKPEYEDLALLAKKYNCTIADIERECGNLPQAVKNVK